LIKYACKRYKKLFVCFLSLPKEATTAATEATNFHLIFVVALQTSKLRQRK